MIIGTSHLFTGYNYGLPTGYLRSYYRDPVPTCEEDHLEQEKKEKAQRAGMQKKGHKRKVIHQQQKKDVPLHLLNMFGKK